MNDTPERRRVVAVPGSRPGRLLDLVRAELRTRHYSLRTEQA